jgi:hypothetical protein
MRLGWSFERALIPRAVPRRVRHVKEWEAAGARSFQYEWLLKHRAAASKVICNDLFDEDLSEGEYRRIADFCSLKNHLTWKGAGMNESTGSDWRVDLSSRQKQQVEEMFREFMFERGYIQ